MSEIPPAPVAELTKITTEYEESSDDEESEVIDIAKVGRCCLIGLYGKNEFMFIYCFYYD